MAASTTDRINRKEAKDIQKQISKILYKYCTEYILAGSYRREVDEMGDLDFILIDGNLLDLIPALIKQGKIIQVLRQGNKLASVLIEYKKKAIQLEFSSVLARCYGAGLLHATGNGKFNAQLRTYANQKGYLLNQYGLFTSDKRYLIASETEDSIFRYLDLIWIPPNQRDDGFWTIKDEYKLLS